MRKLKKPYIRKQGEVSGFTVWIVDGKFVRKHIDKEFTSFGHHNSFNFIPRDEFWIDKPYGEEDDTKYYVDRMLLENRLMQEGMDYDSAFTKARRFEKSERKKSSLFRKLLRKKVPDRYVLKRLRIKQIKKYGNENVMVWIVRGKLVRDIFYVDFAMGGHGKVYTFIPDNEVWIEDDVAPSERKYILLHELCERNLMTSGLKYGTKCRNRRIYMPKTFASKVERSAHDIASDIEYFYRHHPEGIDLRIREELERAKRLG